MQNEYGLSAWKVIVGVEILNVGGGLSVDDITNEEQATFVARTMTPWVPWAANAGDVDYPAGADGQGFTTGVPEPGESIIPKLDASVLTSYKEWAGLE